MAVRETGGEPGCAGASPVPERGPGGLLPAGLERSGCRTLGAQDRVGNGFPSSFVKLLALRPERSCFSLCFSGAEGGVDPDPWVR